MNNEEEDQEMETSTSNASDSPPKDWKNSKLFSKLEDFCGKLNLHDKVPNRSCLEVTLQEVLQKAENDEGYIEYIESHRDTSIGKEYLVKWIGFKDLTWEKDENIPGDVKYSYDQSL